jgi:hypothetical protein
VTSSVVTEADAVIRFGFPACNLLRLDVGLS